MVLVQLWLTSWSQAVLQGDKGQDCNRCNHQWGKVLDSALLLACGCVLCLQLTRKLNTIPNPKQMPKPMALCSRWENSAQECHH
jgi:hypothetical protein